MGGLSTSTHQSTCRDDIYKIDESAEILLRCAGGSREMVRVGSYITLIAHFRIAFGVLIEYLETHIHRWEPYLRPGRIRALLL